MERIKEFYLTHKKVCIIVIICVLIFILAVIVTQIVLTKKANSKSQADAKNEVTQKDDKTASKNETVKITFDKAGTYSDKKSYDIGYIKAGDVVVENASFKTLDITSDVGEGNVTLNNVTVTKELQIQGGGNNSITLNAGKYASVVVKKNNTHVVEQVNTEIGSLSMTNSNYLEVFGSIAAVTVSKTDATNINWNVGIKVYEGGSVKLITLNAPIAITGVAGTITQVKASDSTISTQITPFTSTATQTTETAPANTPAETPANTPAATPDNGGTTSNPSANNGTTDNATAIKQAADKINWQTMPYQTDYFASMGGSSLMPAQDAVSYCDQLTASARDEATAFYAANGYLDEETLSQIAAKYAAMGSAQFGDYQWDGGGTVMASTEQSMAPGYACGYYSLNGSCFSDTSTDNPGGYITIFCQIKE